MKKRYSLIISYDGTPFTGWQVQPNGVSIQATIQNALETILQEKTVYLTGSSRTDAGVHAHGQVAHFDSTNVSSIDRLQKSLNGFLPKEIKILQIREMPLDFHSRYQALRKRYYYDIHLEKYPDPFNYRYRFFHPYEIDWTHLQSACSLFEGTHDFTSFANEAHKGCAANQPIKTLYQVKPVEIPSGVRIYFEGNGFLYKMVRNIVGTLIEVAQKRMPIEDITKIFDAKDRTLAKQAAPAKGLFLEKVIYPDTLGFS